ncbi:MAG: MFS transporter, partial [SAR324 cluster bacterium]|nr:MFS transporter [SAR324 cluster bacterium]
MAPLLFLRVFLPFALGYFISYFFRNVNAIIEADLVGDLNFSAANLGLLTSVYFISFASFQLPLGLLLDRFGPRRTESVLLIFAALGALIFSMAESLSGLILGRLLIGFGVSACLMASFKAYVLWFPPDRLPLMNGLQMVAGGLGAMSATVPLRTALEFTDWRGVFLILSGLTLFSALVLWLVYPEKEGSAGPVPMKKQLEGLKTVLTSRPFLAIAPLVMFSQSAQMAIQGLWAKPWLRDVAGLDEAECANHLMWMMAAMMAGFFLIGLLSERLYQARKISPVSVGVSAMAVFIVLQLLMALGWTAQPMLLMTAFSFFATAGILPYAGLSQIFPKALSGRVSTSLNLTVFLGAFAVQWGLGEIINLWPTERKGYAPESYGAAFGSLAVLQLFGLLWFIVLNALKQKAN